MKGSIFSKRVSSPSRHSSVSGSPSSTLSRSSHQTFSESMMEENLDLAEVIITASAIDAHRHQEFSSLFVDDRREARKFLDAVSSLQHAMHYYVKLSSGSDQLVRAQNLMQIAIKRLEKEFHLILSANRKNLDSESPATAPGRDLQFVYFR